MGNYIYHTFTKIPTFLLKAIDTCLFDDNVQNAVSDCNQQQQQRTPAFLLSRVLLPNYVMIMMV